jgi:hypothetical protein
LAEAGVRCANLISCLLLVFIVFAGIGSPLFATDLKSPRPTYPEVGRSDPVAAEKRLAAFCYSQRVICRKICYMRSRFEDSFDGCPQSCETREIRCNGNGCYRWSESEFLIAENFGGFRCP